MIIDLAVLADAANVTQESKLNIIGIFRQFFPPTLPLIYPKFNIVISLTAEREDLGTTHDFEVTFKNIDGELLNPVATGTISVPNIATYNYPMLNIILNVNNFQIPESGTYYFEFLLNGKQKTKIPLLVDTPKIIYTNQLNPPQ